MPSSGGGKTQSQKTITEPWKPSQGGLVQSLVDVKKLYDQGGLVYDYPDETYAPLSPETQQAWGGIASRAQAGNPLVGKSQSYVDDVISGKYLNADAPGAADMRSKIIDQVNASKSMTGRYGSEAHSAALGRELGALEYGRYMGERGFQDSAAALAPTLAREDYYDLDRLAQVGGARQEYLQGGLDDEAARQQWEQQKYANAIALYQSLLGGGYGGSTTAYVPTQSPNRWLGGLGGAASGASAGAMFGPWGALAGGVLGGAAGAFGG